MRSKKKNPMGLTLFIFSGVWAMDALVLHPPRSLWRFLYLPPPPPHFFRFSFFFNVFLITSPKKVRKRPPGLGNFFFKF